MSKRIIEPLLLEGGDDVENIDRDKKKSKALWCNHEEDEPCGPQCVFQKFPKDKTNDKALKKSRKNDRINFVKKTYGILLTQLIFTAGFVGASVATPAIEQLVQSIWVPAVILAVVSILALVFGSAD